VQLELRGIPCVCIVEDAFLPPARLQAQMLGMPDVRMVVIPRGSNSKDVLRQRADHVFDDIVRALRVD
jgi:hypothetical protein